jgi:hypothetical protein
MKTLFGLLISCLLQFMLITAVNSQDLGLTPSIRVQTQHDLPDSLAKKTAQKVRYSPELPKSVQAKKSNTPGQIDYIWGKYMSTSYSDRFYSSTIDNSGNVIAVGSIGYGSDDVDAIIYKFDSEGNLLWSDKPASSNSYDGIYSVVTDKNENIYITGKFYYSAFNGLISSYGDADMFIAKYNSDGILLWAKKAGGSDNDYGCQVALDNAGNVYVVGFINGTAYWEHISKTSSAQGDMFIAKYDGQGNIQWVRTGNIGAANYLHGIGTDKTGNSYVSANFSGEMYFEGAPAVVNSRGGTDIFLVKYDTNGNFSWIRTAGSTGDDGGNDTSVDEDGNILIAGYFTDNAQFENKTLTAHGLFDIFAAKYSPNGSLIWVKQFGGTGSQTAWAICSDEKSNCYLTGWFSGTGAFDNTTIVSEGGTDAYVIKYNKNGNLIWVEPTGTGSGQQVGSGVFVKGDKLSVNGYYNDETHIQGHAFPNSGDNDDGYIALFNQKDNIQTTVYVNPYLSLSASQIKAGESISFSGSQFSPVGKVDLTFAGTGIIDPVIDYAIDVTGYFHCTVATPASLKSGQYYVTGTDKISGKSVTRTFQIIKEQQAEVDNFLRITEPNMSKIRYTGDQIVLSWEDKAKFNVNPLYNYKHSYKVEYKINDSDWKFEKNVSGSNPGYGTINNSFFFTPEYVGLYTFRITDNYYANRSVTTPEIDVIIHPTSEIEIDFKWDKNSSLNQLKNHPNGVAADGVARFYIIVSNKNQYESGIQHIKLSLSDPDNYTTSPQYLGKVSYCFPQDNDDFSFDGNNANSISAENNTSNIDNKYWFWYVAPDDFARNEGDWQKDKRFVKASFEITLLNGNTIDPIEKEIEIVRPPLMLVHGLNGDPGTWDKFPTGYNNTLFIGDSKFKVKKAVRMEPNSRFSTNADQLLADATNTSSFQHLINEMRNLGYACNQLDYVCHSMGGSILRYAVDSIDDRFSTQANYDSGFVNKFISLHTPHDGSSFANFLEDIDKMGLKTLLIQLIASYKKIDLFKCDAIGCHIVDAVSDLRYKNGIKFSQTNIPSHLIGSSSPYSGFNEKTDRILTNLKIFIINSQSWNKDNYTLYTEYFSEHGYEATFFDASDAIVSASSQFSKLNTNSLPDNCTFIPRLMHNSTFGDSPTDSELVGKKVDTLLNVSVNSTYFNSIPATINQSSSKKAIPAKKRKTYISEEKISIISPAENAFYQVGDTINIRLQVDTTALKGLALFFQGQNYFETPATNEIEYRLVISPEHIETQSIMVIGGYVVSDSTYLAYTNVDVYIYTPDSLIDFVVSPEIMMIEAGNSRQSDFTAIYSRAISRIGRTDSIFVVIEDSSVVAYDAYYSSFTGLKKGNTSATLTYKGISKTMFFEIIQVEDSLDDETSVTELTMENNRGQLNIIAYPNPFSEEVSFKYTLSETAPTCLDIYTIYGVKIKTFDLGRQAKGTHHQRIELSELPNGIYIYRLTSGDISLNGGIIKM